MEQEEEDGRIGGGVWGVGGFEGKRFCFASEPRNPQKPMWSLMSCHTPSAPSCHATTSVTRQFRVEHPSPPPAHLPENVRHWREALGETAPKELRQQ